MKPVAGVALFGCAAFGLALVVMPQGCVNPEPAASVAEPAGKSVPVAAPILYPPSEPGRSRESYIATGTKAMIATAHPLATEAGFKILRAGGNAIDAAVAASFVISVVRPQSTGIGGGGFLVGYEAAGAVKGQKLPAASQLLIYDFRERAPSQASRDMYLDKSGNPVPYRHGSVNVPDASVNGHLAVGVPGLVKGLLDVHARYGRLPLETVMQPAILAADQGFTVYPGLAGAISEREAVMRQFSSTTKIFFPGGKALKVGDTLIQKDLAWSLREIARQGATAYYSGPIAQRIVAEMQRGGGLLTLADLAAYQAVQRPPVVSDYRGNHIVSMPPPSSGGAHIIQMLNILAPEPYGALAWGQAPSVHLLAETMRRAFADRAEYLGDPDFVKIPLKGIISPAYALKLRQSIDMARATPSSAVKPGRPMDYETPSTSHISVVDQWGNAVSTTQTVNYTFGSCVVAEGTGIVLNDEMDDFSIKPGVPNAYGLVGSAANAVTARKVPLSSMSPTLVFAADGKLRLVLGSPGGPRIITATLQTILNVIDHQYGLPDAVHATRIHHQWLPDELRIEKDGLSPDVQTQLTKMGHQIVAKGSIGDVQAVEINASGLTGVSDTRSEGKPMGF